MNAVVYSDGGKNGNGCYGSFMAVVDGEDYPHKRFVYDELKTAPEAEVMTMMQALLYIQDLNTRYPDRVSWELILDAKFLHDHVTGGGERKVAMKFKSKIIEARKIIAENNVEVRQVSGEYMKLILGH